MTASHAQAIASNGSGLKTYILEKLVDKYSSAEKEIYSNEHMERGNELEGQARSLYWLETGKEVQEVGFCELDEYTGCSPDGMIGEKGLIEIKCPTDKNFLKLLIEKKISSSYVWQMQMQMYVTGRKWCDFVAYCPNFEKSFYIERVEADIEKFDKIKEGLAEGRKLIKKYIKMYEG